MPTEPSNTTLLNTIRNGIAISFLGPDGSGKSTIIEGLLKQQLPFEQNDYFHLKPLFKKEGAVDTVVANPHAAKPYNAPKSYMKLLFFIYQYNKGWYRNVVPLKRKKSLVIFDRYYDDLLVDSRRYRYGGSRSIAKWVRNLIPRPALYFILTADADIIYKRKKEVAFTELKRQIIAYRSLADGKRYHSINVDRTPEEIVAEVKQILISHVR